MPPGKRRMEKSKIVPCGMAMALAMFVSPCAAWSADVPAKTPASASVKAPAGVPAHVPVKASAGVLDKGPASAPAKVPANTPPAESYSYNPAGKPDPFVPFIETEPLRSKTLEKTSSPSIFPLRNASIDQFKLVGIAGDERRRIAAVEDEKGKVYTLFEGTYIGQNNGRVKSILADRVIVEEKFGTDSGNARINRITMKLHKEDRDQENKENKVNKEENEENERKP